MGRQRVPHALFGAVFIFSQRFTAVVVVDRWKKQQVTHTNIASSRSDVSGSLAIHWYSSFVYLGY